MRRQPPNFVSLVLRIGLLDPDGVKAFEELAISQTRCSLVGFTNSRELSSQHLDLFQKEFIDPKVKILVVLSKNPHRTPD